VSSLTGFCVPKFETQRWIEAETDHFSGSSPILLITRPNQIEGGYWLTLERFDMYDAKRYILRRT
jgi:hypothetical protein